MQLPIYEVHPPASGSPFKLTPYPSKPSIFHLCNVLQGDIVHLFRLVTFCVQYFVIIFEFILAFLPEPKSQLHQHIDSTQEVMSLLLFIYAC